MGGLCLRIDCFSSNPVSRVWFGLVGSRLFDVNYSRPLVLLAVSLVPFVLPVKHVTLDFTGCCNSREFGLCIIIISLWSSGIY